MQDKIETIGLEIIKESATLLIPNQIDYLILQQIEKLFKNKHIVYLVDENSKLDESISNHIDQEGIEAFLFSITDTLVEDLSGALREDTRKNVLFVYITGKSIAWPLTYLHILPEVIEYLLKLGIPTVPLYLLRNEDLITASEKQTKKQDKIIYSFGDILENENLALPHFQESLLLAGNKAFSSNPKLNINLAYALLNGLKKHSKTAGVFDGYIESFFSYEKILSISLVFSKIITKATTKKRVGIVLTPGIFSFATNLGILFANKTPVNLNFTSSVDAIKFSIEQADIDIIFTAEPFKNKLKQFPWLPEDKVLLIERLITKLKHNIIRTSILNKFFPASVIASLYKIPKLGGDKEAVLLFTSGSVGAPKGVSLTHRNLITNIKQITYRLGMHPGEKILGCLPLFHSFGCTVTLWYPIIEGLTVVTYPSPLEIKKLSSLIYNGKISLLLTTPTFLRAFIRTALKKQLDSLKFVVTGAEKLPIKIADAFKNKFDKPVMEGYGLTETSPVSNVNLPQLNNSNETSIPILRSHKDGSVGQLVPGIAIKITNPETAKHLPLNQIGQIWLKGDNIFKGYLNQPKLNSEILIDEWFATGDLGKVDADGFLHIEGRLSRFSKIGGEMVPHETIEQAIISALNIDESEKRIVTIVGIPDEKKGEALTLLYAGNNKLDVKNLQKALNEKGVTNLWIPKKIIKVSEIPILASGKINIQQCKAIAES